MHNKCVRIPVFRYTLFFHVIVECNLRGVGIACACGFAPSIVTLKKHQPLLYRPIHPSRASSGQGGTMRRASWHGAAATGMGAWSCGPAPGGPSGRNRPVVSLLCRAALACLPGHASCCLACRHSGSIGPVWLPCPACAPVAWHGMVLNARVVSIQTHVVRFLQVTCPCRQWINMTVIVLHPSHNHHRGACGTQKAVLSYLFPLCAISIEYHADNLRFHESFMHYAPEKSSCPAGLVGL